MAAPPLLTPASIADGLRVQSAGPAAHGPAGRWRALGDRLPDLLGAGAAAARAGQLRPHRRRRAARLRRRGLRCELRLRHQPDGRVRRRPRAAARGGPAVGARWLTRHHRRATPLRSDSPAAPDLPGLARAARWRTCVRCCAGRSTGCSAASTSCRRSRRRATAASRRSRTTGSIPRFGAGRTSRTSRGAHTVLLDLMVNHISRHSPEFQAFAREGRRRRTPTCSSRSTRSGRTASRPAEDVARMFLRKPDGPFSTITIGPAASRGDGLDHLRRRRLVRADRPRPAVRRRPATSSTRLAGGLGLARRARWSASTRSAMSSRRPGTTCFMVEPEIWEFLDWIVGGRRRARPDPAARGPRRLRDA